MTKATAGRQATPWGWQDWACLAALLLTTVLVRYRSLNPIPVNPDEAEYEALAAYASSAGVSVFSIPAPYSYTAFVYQLFGPYGLAQVRTLVLLILSALEVLLFLVVRRSANRWAGLLSAWLCLLLNPFFEGITANREWFASLPLFFGMYLVLTADDAVPAWRAFAGGICCCVGVWFKDQAVAVAATVPLLLAVEAVITRQYRARLWTILVFALGGLAGAVCYLLPFAAQGRLAAQVQGQLGFVRSYGLENAAAGAPVGLWEYFYGHYFLAVGFRWLMGVVYLTALVLLGRMALAMARYPLRPSFLDGRGPRLMALYLLTGAIAVGAGGRFFGHYYLFLLVPIAALYAFATYGIIRFLHAESIRRQPATALSRLVVLAATLALVLPAANLVGTVPPLSAARQSFLQNLEADHPHLAPFCSLLIDPGWQPSGPFTRTFVLYSDGRTSRAFDVARRLRPAFAPGDTLFVWGWKPELYSGARVPPATSFVTCNLVARDLTVGAGRHNVDRQALADLMRQLNSRPPRVIVDAAENSYTMSNLGATAPAAVNPYNLEDYTEFKNFLDSRYRYEGSYGPFRFYMRCER